jgi:Uma2 family endonuclease
MATTELLRAEDLLSPDVEGHGWELVRGRLVEVPLVGAQHGVAAVRVASLLLPHADRHGGYVGVEIGYILARDPDTLRGPDVSYLRPGRLPESGPPRTFLEGPPDLAVEILSPGDRPTAVADKLRDYLDAGTPLVWILDCAARTVAVHTGTGPPTVLGPDDILDGGDVLPGFTVRVGEIFA